MLTMNGLSEEWRTSALGFGTQYVRRSPRPMPDDSWNGWWGEEPPYHVPVFVLSHHPREPLEMKGGTVFHFVTDGIHAALQRAKDAAKDKDSAHRRRRRHNSTISSRQAH